MPLPGMSTDQDVEAWLQSGAAFAGGRPPLRIDTHAASIFLAEDRAWKLKRPVRFPFLDFSTPDRRRAALEEEVRLNRRTAPDLYIGVHAINRTPDGILSLDGQGAPVDWLMEMRRFPDEALLAHRADGGALPNHLLQELADEIADFHAKAEIDRGGDGSGRLRAVVQGNAASMVRFSSLLDPSEASTLTARLLALVERHAGLLDARAEAGRVRHGHGDLHLANIAVIEGRPTLFDCLEFDASLATTDVLYDLAFLLMDLWQRRLRREASIVFNRYLDRSALDEEAILLLPLFMSIRATVRAHVMAAQAAGKQQPTAADQARRYLALAQALIEPAAARLIAIGGLSGSGKSTLARQVAGEIGPAPGARVLRSDVLRKRLAGVDPETPLAPSAYTAAASDRVYQELCRLAGQALAGGSCVIADAVFGRDEERGAVMAVAERAGCRFDGFWLDLGEAERIGRIEGRGPDASDADAGVARRQSASLAPPEAGWVILPVTDVAETAERLCANLRGRSA